MDEMNCSSNIVANLKKGLELLIRTRDATTHFLEEMRQSCSATPYCDEVDKHISTLSEQAITISENIREIQERLNAKIADSNENSSPPGSITNVRSQSPANLNISESSSVGGSICRNYLTKGFCRIQTCPFLHSSSISKKKHEVVEDNEDKMEVYDPSLEYQPQDESRICKFYMMNSKCWKKNCQYEHIKPYKWTHDTLEVYCYPFNTIILPEVGTKVDLIVTGIESIVKLYCQLPKEYSDIGEGVAYFETLDDLEKDMNLKSVVSNYKALLVDPAEGEIVIAKVGKRWYRATVVGIDDSEVTVFLSDYGTHQTVKASDLRAITPRFLHLPFQAVACQIYNLAYNINSPLPSSEISFLGTQFLSEFILHETISAIVKYKDIDNECITISANFKGMDVGEALILEGFCVPFNE